MADTREYSLNVLTPAPSTGDMIPFFRLMSAAGEEVRSWDFKGKKNLVIFFTHSLACERCRDYLMVLASRYSDIAGEETEVIAIVPASFEDVAEAKRRLELPYIVLSDPDGATHAGFGAVNPLGQPTAAIYVSDRYGQIYVDRVAGEDDELLSYQDVLSWLLFIEYQCPECGAPEWRVASR